MTRMTENALVGRVVEFADRNSRVLRQAARFGLVVPGRWSGLFGYIAAFSFVVVFVSGVILFLWFEPSMARVVYDGGYSPLRGVSMSEAYASTVDISFEVRGGLLIRQVHNWASLVFVAALSAHVLRLFLVGAFRGPRRWSWLVVLAVLVLGIVEAFIGHLLPDDLLSGTSLRVTEGYLLATPMVGTWLASLVFGGEFPGDDIIGRLNIVHALLPALIVALFVINVALTYRQRTQTWRTGSRDKRAATGAAGEAVAPASYAARMGGLLMLVAGVIVVMSATIQVNPVWLWGPAEPAQASAGSTPPWYLGFLDGAVRLMPAWDIHVFGHELTLSVIVPVMVLPAVTLGALVLYPWFEQWVTRDQRDPDTVDRPRNMPTRTGLGAAFVAFYLVLLLAGGNDTIATVMQVSVNGVTRFLQISLFVLPPLAFLVTKRVCLGLQLRDRDQVVHGRATGVIIVTPDGGFAESHDALSAYQANALSARPQWAPLDPGAATDANGVRNPTFKIDSRRASLSRFYFADVVPKPTAPESEDHPAAG